MDIKRKHTKIFSERTEKDFEAGEKIVSNLKLEI